MNLVKNGSVRDKDCRILDGISQMCKALHNVVKTLADYRDLVKLQKTAEEFNKTDLGKSILKAST